MTALQQGDYDVAFKAAMAGVKLALATTIDAMAGMWETFWSGAWKAAQTFMKNFVELSMKVVSAVAEALANPTQGAAKLGWTLGQMSKDMNLSFSIDTKGMASTHVTICRRCQASGRNSEIFACSSRTRNNRRRTLCWSQQQQRQGFRRQHVRRKVQPDLCSAAV